MITPSNFEGVALEAINRATSDQDNRNRGSANRRQLTGVAQKLAYVYLTTWRASGRRAACLARRGAKDCGEYCEAAGAIGQQNAKSSVQSLAPQGLTTFGASPIMLGLHFYSLTQKARGQPLASLFSLA